MPSYAALLAAARARPSSAPPSSRRRRPRRSAAWRRRRERGRAITFIFIGWSVASVARHADRGLARRHLRLAQRVRRDRRARRARRASGSTRSMPDGVRPAALSLRRLEGACSTNPVLMAIVAGHRARRRRPVHAVLVLRAVLQARARRRHDARSACSSSVFGVFGVIGNTLDRRATIDRFGADRAVGSRSALMALSLLAWPLGDDGFVAAWRWCSCRGRSAASPRNSAQQARLGVAAPALRARR